MIRLLATPSRFACMHMDLSATKVSRGYMYHW